MATVIGTLLSIAPHIAGAAGEQMSNVPRYPYQRPAEYAVAILRDSALTHADLKTLIGLLASEVGDLDRCGQYTGYDAVSEHLDNASDALDECYAAGVDLDDAVREEVRREWAAEARAFNGGAA